MTKIEYSCCKGYGYIVKSISSNLKRSGEIMGISIDCVGMTKEEILKRKLEQAKTYLGDKLVTAKDSTFSYKRGPTVLGQKK